MEGSTSISLKASLSTTDMPVVSASVYASDFAVLKKLLARLIFDDDASVVHPDVNGDNAVNASDLAFIKKMLAGL